ncbi:MAG: glycosyltransferase [Acidimicrobiales bacterium]
MTSGSRIIIVNDSSTARGGATGLALLAARLLAERGREVVLLCGDSGDDPALADLGVTVLAIGGERLLTASRPQALVGGLWNRRAAAFITDWIARNGRPDDVWHLHSWAQIWSPSIFRALRPVIDRLVVHGHDYFPACPGGGFWNYPASSACELVPMSRSCVVTNCDKRSRSHKVWRVARHRLLGEVFTGPRMPLVLLIHPGMATAFERSGLDPARLRVLRNPAQPFLAAPASPQDNKQLLFVGRLAPEKGALELAVAAARIGAPVTFVGEGPMEARIRAAFPDAALVGWQDRQGLARYAAEARALVMPTLYPEPFGMVAVEALASGLPVAASATALLAPEIARAGAGWQFDAFAPGALSETLAAIVDVSSTELAAKSRLALAVAPGLASTPTTWIDGLEEVYASLVAEGA